jgi:glycosyltransferase involved in cell wall biosynthesis
VPVFNRPDEIKELLESLLHLEYKNFEVIVVEDGSEVRCKDQTEQFSDKLDLFYFYKSNTGPGHSRNLGASKATGDYLIFFDSDCIIPSEYLNLVNQYLSHHKLDVFGGPDKEHHDFTLMQKAINYAMTSVLTTGGIRGHRITAGNFQPRSFNMGINRKVFLDVGGFSNIHPGEDPDLVYKVTKLGYVSGLIPDAFVYHKRRINLKKFSSQVYKFGLARSILMKWHPASRKPVFWFPTLALIATMVMLVMGWQYHLLWYAILTGLIVVFADAFRRTGNVVIAILGVGATIVQIASYAVGFMNGWWQLHLLANSAKEKFPDLFKGHNSKFSD